MRLTLEVELPGPGALVRGLGGVPPGSSPPVPQQAPALTLPFSGELQGRAPSRVRGTAGGLWLPSSGAASKPVTLGIFSLCLHFQLRWAQVRGWQDTQTLL